jgi:hypothetical protein
MPLLAILRVPCQLHSYCTITISVAQRKKTVFLLKVSSRYLPKWALLPSLHNNAQREQTYKNFKQRPIKLKNILNSQLN